MKNILIIEDNLDNLELVKQILEDEGYCVLAAHLAEQGLEILAQQSVDLVLMDICLPQVDGYEAIRRIRRNPDWKQLPIITLTAHAMQKDSDAALAAGSNAFISKPLDESVLLELIRGFIANP